MGWHIKGIWVLVIFLIVQPALAETTYFFEVAESGETTVKVELTESRLLTLPPDVKEPDVQGGTFEKRENGIYVSTNNTATITYTSSYQTKKEAGVWYFETNVKADQIKLVLPQAVHVVQTIPKAAITKEDTWQLEWNNITADVSVSYVRVNQAEISQNVIRLKPVHIPGQLIILIILLATGTAYFLLRKRKTERLPKMSEGQLNIMRAVNPNEATILKIILKNNGQVKRNILEKESQLSKSSLASALKNLEHKNIVAIDRAFFVHYISLTQWFKEL